ncbi:MAG: EMC3/TMCO1 family protein [Candidatus Bathyarchaeota archaeon]|nr:EMC3/TMCO1 family protein [Candidatus Bathyarchaeota archaeon]
MLPGWLAELPISTVFILVLAMLMTFLTSFINRLLTKEEQLKQLRAWRGEVSVWNADLRKARRSGDKKLLQKVMKKEKRIRQIQMKMASQSFRQMKTIPIFMILFVFVWLPLTGRIPLPFLYGTQLLEAPFSSGGVVAYLPWFGGVLPLDLFGWYFLCSIAFGAFFTRVFGLGMQEAE